MGLFLWIECHNVLKILCTQWISRNVGAQSTWMAFCREGKALGEVHLELECAKTVPRVQIYLTQRY